MFKNFSRDLPKMRAISVKEYFNEEGKPPHLREVGMAFTLDDSWRAEAVDLIGIKEGKIVPLPDPEAKPTWVLFLTVGRGRRFRYVVSDGKTYSDLHGTVISGDRTNRRQWCKQKGPWKFTSSYKKSLNQTAQKVIVAAIKWASENKSL